jgi:transposase
MRTMLKNRIHSILHRRGILNLLKDLFTKDGRKWLGEIKLDEAGRLILDGYLGTLDQLGETIDESTSALTRLSKSQRWCKQVALLKTMPGIGPITSLTILAELGDIHRFKSRAAVSNYTGIVPVVRDSNEKKFSGHITHRGPAHLRSVLVEAAWTSVGRVPQYSAIYHRIAAKKAKQIAIVAVARRMLEDAWTMLKRDEVFRLMTVTSNVADVHSVSTATDEKSAAAVTRPIAG